ncbi:MAG TPA: monovalent cation:proton antiporter-2 (CPA2) family protein [Casimicrobiaceae bacterium]|nr:monovalent cation:proton antiporter-2 (CPA2) family protein [Casimicrobiaceae bacterium]
MPQTLASILVLLGASVVVVVVCRIARLPPILGYLLVGLAVGPHGARWVEDTHSTRYLAEFGIVFLMFSLGLEFSLAQLRAMRRAVFGLGLAQVAVTTLCVAIALPLAGFDWKAGLVVGGALAMSSTAIVSKMLTERMELGTPHGRDVIAILLFQDLAVVAFLIVIPALGRSAEDLTVAIAFAAMKGVVALMLILGFGQRPMRAWFNLVARQRSPELFVLNVLLVTLGLGALTEVAGLSMALGAFLAGMLIAETEFRFQVEEDIKPFRDVLLGLFFVTVGMSLDLAQVVSNAGYVLLLLVVPLAFKLAVVVILARAFGAPLASSLRTGFYLAQASELALVMLALAVDVDVVPGPLAQVVLAAMVLSMLAAPVVIQFAEPIVRRLTANDWLARAAQLTTIASTAMARQEHVLICGYGRSGQNLARLLEREDIPFVALDNDPQRVREAAGAGASVVYGDAGRRETLVAAGLPKARALAITFADTQAALRILHHAQALRPDLPVIVRTFDDSDLDRLVSAGAAEVVPEVLEGSLMLASHTLLVLGIPLNRVLARIRAVREERYSLFRGFFHGATDVSDAADNLQPRLHSVLLPEGAWAVGRTLGELGLAGVVEVNGVRRRGLPSTPPAAGFRLDAGDVVVLLGRPTELAIAEARLLEG